MGDGGALVLEVDDQVGHSVQLTHLIDLTFKHKTSYSFQLSIIYPSVLLQDILLLDQHLVEHESVLDEEDQDGRKGKENGLEEEDPLPLGRRWIETEESRIIVNTYS